MARERAEGEAFVFLERALDLIREQGLTSYEEALTLEAYGNLRFAEGDPERGEPQLRAAADIYRRIGRTEAANEILARVSRHPGGAKEDQTKEDEPNDPHASGGDVDRTGGREPND